MSLSKLYDTYVENTRTSEAKVKATSELLREVSYNYRHGFCSSDDYICYCTCV